MKRFFAAAAALVALWSVQPVSARAAEATFERNLTVGGQVDLSVTTGSGSIRLTQGAGNRVHIFGRVRSGWGSNEADVKAIAADPPIEQTGNIVRVGARHQNFRNISIDYEIQAPANAFLDAATGSGSINDEGVGSSVKLSAGSGSIRATGLQGGYSLQTGSGHIYAEQMGHGDGKAETGSGGIELKNINGALYAQTGSGSVKISGTPAGPWRIGTGSGSVDLWTGGAGISLDAHTGSGGIQCDREITFKGGAGRHHLVGKIGGGGPTVRVSTGSGGVRIH